MTGPDARWLTRRQVLLLRAALWKGPHAVEAWDEWQKGGVDLDRLDTSSTFLLGQLYANLKMLGVGASPLLERVKGVYRHTWARTQALADAAVPAVRAFQSSGIDSMMIKGLSLSVIYYGDDGARRMSGVDILVPQEKFGMAAGILKELGWTPRSSSPEQTSGILHSAAFLNPNGLRLDLHGHLLLECCSADADKDFWDDSIATQWKGLELRALSPADQLFHACVYGLSSYDWPPLRWAADAWKILEAAGRGISWDRLVQQAGQRRLVAPVREAVTFLKSELGADIPPSVIEELNRRPVAFGERLEHALKFRGQRYFGSLPLWWFSCRRLNKSGRSIGFPRYLQYCLGLNNPAQIPWFVAKSGLKRMAKVGHG
jgi:hypothetical protein